MSPTAQVKPINIIYGVDEKPPFVTTLMLAIQHILLLSGSLIFPVLIVQSINGPSEIIQGMVSMSMIAGGAGTIFQALKGRPIGSGYLAPEGGSEPYLPGAFLAVQTGGYPLLFGMTIIAGVFQGLIARIIKRIRFLFPPEVTGVVVFMVGASIIPVSVRLFLGIDGIAASEIALPSFIVGVITFAAIVGTNIWGKGNLRQYCMIIGIIIGYILAYFFGLFTPANFKQLSESSFLALPYVGYIGWSFDIAVLAPFLIAAICASLKCIGDLTTCQKINDANWKRPDMDNISKGILAESAKTMFGALIGGLAHTTCSANIGLSLATGATSRIIAYVAGGIFILMAFFPKVAAFFAIMPQPVMGATLIFCVAFMLLSGIQIIMSRMIDIRKTIVIGTSIIFGVSVDMTPGLYSNVSAALQPLCSSSLTLATITVLLLNLIFRIGIAQKKTIELVHDEENNKKIFDFMEKQGGAWAAQREVVFRAAAAMNEFIESAASLELTVEPIIMEVVFDEFNLDVNISYYGTLMEFPSERPSERDLLEDENAFVKLSGYLMRHYADRIKTDYKDGRCFIQFHFDH
ncbi:uracil-xanthine permease family protein [Pelotomaculum propionicicum]|uniref:uracil-xanthine permease family protein n=1 Tax=Pelotomaculum propionicicum TaxID=258475 RepID=UPI003B7A9860